MKKNTDIVLGLSFLAIVAIGMLVVASRGGTGSPQAASLVGSVIGWEKGSADAKVVLVEYSDFQCPACAAYYPLVKQVMQEFGDQVKFVYRHFPLVQIHANALSAARAAEAAGNQGKFWEMHDLLFEQQDVWESSRTVDATFAEYAVRLGLDMVQFKSDESSKETEKKILNDYQTGLVSGVAGTPTFFLNGKKINNPRNYEQFRTIILEALSTQQ